MILCLETATPVCSVTLIDNGEVVAIRESVDGQNHAEKITIFIDEVMKEARLTYSQLDAVAISKGPGSYTGLRIGVSTAKGLCYAAEKPLIAIDTLHAMAFGAAGIIGSEMKENGLYCPMIDARRMEVYTAFFDDKLNRMTDTEAVVLEEDSFAEMRKKHHLYLMGDGADKLGELFFNSNSISVIKDFRCSARHHAQLATMAFNNNDFVDVAYFEPYYLKNFVPGTPTVKGLKQS